MEYISAEEFKKQPKEVQQVFLDWWEPSVGDICAFKAGHSGYYSWYMSCIQCERDIEAKLHEIPLLTEGQLRKFVEDKTQCKFDVMHCEDTIYLNSYDLSNLEGMYLDEYSAATTDLIQAYWKVACDIAKEVINQ